MVMLTVAVGNGEEIETRKTIKMAVKVKNDIESRTDEPLVNTIKDEPSQEVSSQVSMVQEISTTRKDNPTTIKVEPLIDVSSEPSPSSFNSESTISVALESSSESITSSTAAQLSNSESLNVSAENPSDESPEDENESESNNVLPLNETPKRKVVYINQQQNGKLNVHLELSDVSVIVIPNQKDPQLSLLSLLLKSAQKSNAQSEMKKKEVVSTINQPDEYSKYTRRHEEYVDASIMPFIESRAPYKVDISSTLGQQPAVEIVPNAHQHSTSSLEQQFQPQFARSPIMQLLKPSTYVLHSAQDQARPSNRIFKRSIDSRLLKGELNSDDENYIHYKDDPLIDSNYNLLDDSEVSDDDINDSEFILLGATENCGPGRKRNSYQVCVSVVDN